MTRYESRFELLPLGQSEEQAAQVPGPLKLAVACSPRLGPDRSVEVARRLNLLGHSTAVHLAARMVRDRDHLDSLLAALAEAGVDDVFLIGGDATPPHGPYESAVDLLPIVDEHPRRPARIGVAGYPEGHPLIDDRRLADALERKSARADYLATQLCFDAASIVAWLAEVREIGVTLPALVGLPGVVDRRRLLAISVRIGVGPSLAYLRKQRGLRALVSHSKVTPDRVCDVLLPALDERPELGVEGFHFYTFNQLRETWDWTREPRAPVSFEEAVTR